MSIRLLKLLRPLTLLDETPARTLTVIDPRTLREPENNPRFLTFRTRIRGRS